MSFIRRIKRKDRVYLAEVENRWIDGKCVQKHIRYVGKEADDKTVLSTALADLEVEQVKAYGPLLVLDHLAQEIKLQEQLGDYGAEILSMVYAHCLDYKSINQMEQWFERTDLKLLLGIEGVTERRLLNALDSLESQDWERLQTALFETVKARYALQVSGVLYDVTIPVWEAMSVWQVGSRQNWGQRPPFDTDRSWGDQNRRYSPVPQGL